MPRPLFYCCFHSLKELVKSFLGEKQDDALRRKKNILIGSRRNRKTNKSCLFQKLTVLSHYFEYVVPVQETPVTDVCDKMLLKYKFILSLYKSYIKPYLFTGKMSYFSVVYFHSVIKRRHIRKSQRNEDGVWTRTPQCVGVE